MMKLALNRRQILKDIRVIKLQIIQDKRARVIV